MSKRSMSDFSKNVKINWFHSYLNEAVDFDDLEGEYFMWNSTDEDASFANSMTPKIWLKIFPFTEKYSSYMIPDLLREIKVLPQDVPLRLELPEESKEVPFLSQEGEKVVLRFSKDKGITFHFSTHTKALFRNTFLKYFYHYCNAIYELVSEHNAESDPIRNIEKSWNELFEKIELFEKEGASVELGKIYPKN